MKHFMGVVALVMVVVTSAHAQSTTRSHDVYALLFFNITTEMETETGFSQFFISSFEDVQTQIRIDSLAVSEYENLDETTNRQKNVTREYVLTTAVSGGVKNRGVIIVTDGPVSVQATRAAPGTTDTYLALPIVKTSQEFYLPSWPTQKVGFAGFGIAAASGSCTELWTIDANGTYERKWYMALDQYDIYQEFARDEGVDMTGWYINSSKPIAVFSGHECAQVPNVRVKYCDHLIEQVPPVDQWGTEAVVGPILGRESSSAYTLRILGASSDTQITKVTSVSDVEIEGDCGCDPTNNFFSSCTKPCLVQPGGFVQLTVKDASEGVLVVCDKPCLVVQYTHSYAYVANEPNRPDPSMVIITPVDHYTNQFSFATPNYVQGTQRREFVNWVTVVARAADRDGVHMNGMPLTGVTWSTLGDYSYGAREIEHGFHGFRHENETVTIMAFVYGHASTGTDPTAYSFPATYAIFGETLKGRWEELIVPDAETTVPTTTAAACTLLSPSVVQLAQLVSVVATASGDLSPSGLVQCKLTVEGSLPQLRTDMNQLICNGSLCPNLPENVYVKDIKAAIIDNAERLIQMDVSFSVGLDVPVKTVNICSQQIVRYLQYWNQPEVNENCGRLSDSLVAAGDHFGSGSGGLACPRVLI